MVRQQWHPHTARRTTPEAWKQPGNSTEDSDGWAQTPYGSSIISVYVCIYKYIYVYTYRYTYIYIFFLVFLNINLLISVEK